MGISKVVTEVVNTTTELAEDVVERLRFDSYLSKFTGLGGSKDKTTGIDFVHNPRFRNQVTINDLYSGDAVAARIVDLLVDDATSKGWTIEFSTTDGDGAETNLDPKKAGELNKRIQAWEKTVNLTSEVKKYWKRGRAHGGGVMVFGLDDGVEDIQEPVNKSINSFDWMRFLTRWDITASTELGDDPKDSATLGLPIYYDLQPSRSEDILSNVRVHATRVFRYEGVQVDDPICSNSNNTQGDTFGDSIFERVWTPLKLWNSALQGAGHIIQDFSQAVYAIHGFRQALRAKGGYKILADQFGVMETFRSMFHATVIDSQDTYERKTTSVTGMPELIDKFGHQLSAASGMPLTLLIGISPGGFGTGEAEDNNWNNIVKAAQQEVLKPLLEYVYSLLFRTKDFQGKVPDTWKIVFNPLKQMSDADQAELQFKQAQTDQINISTGMVTPEEAAQSRYGRGGFSLETHIDQDVRDDFDESESDIASEIASTKTGDDVDTPDDAIDGSQVSSIVNLVMKVAAKELPRDSAIAIIQVAYKLSKEQAEAIVGDSGEGFDPEEPSSSEETQLIPPNPGLDNGQENTEETENKEAGNGETDSQSPETSGEEGEEAR